MPDSRKVRWGILSTANIGVQKVIPGILKSPHSEVVAIASRDLGRAHTALGQLGLRSHARAYGSYEELFADPDVDAIYNPLPNHLHVPMTVAAAKAGKHVLCEKPIALNAAEAEQLRAVPGRRIVARSLHGALPPAMAARPRDRPLGRTGRAARHARASSPTSTPTPPTCATRPISAAAASWTSAATRSPAPASCSRPSRTRVVVAGRPRPRASRPTGWPA